MSEEHSSTGPTHRSWWDRLGHLFTGEPRNRDDLLSELRAAQENGLLTVDTLSMVEGALKVTELSVGDVMVARAQMVMLAADDSLSDILATVIESGHSRFPVHAEDSKDQIVGILLAKDLLRCFVDGAQLDVRSLLRPAVLIPESMPLNMLMAEFKLSRNHMAIVIDEYGGVGGLVTIEDVLEEIVGEIDDEHDEEEPAMIQPAINGGFLVSALAPIEDFNEHFGCTLSDEEFDTIGGLVTAGFGHLPERGEELDLGGFHFHVTAADDRRVQQFRVDSLRESA
ncbi:MAG TPA: transporter associated domain-containing protein [Rhodanobacteraceae bacterium]|nr:transporter associated domain-containing protein [Rhodanobacteraceae bacterium]